MRSLIAALPVATSALAEKSIYWPAVYIIARLDADGRLHVCARKGRRS